MSSERSQRSRSGQSGRRIGLLSTAPPTRCGIATFHAALEAELVRAGDDVTTVTVDDGTTTRKRSSRSATVLVAGDAGSIRDAARVLSRCDVVIAHHGTRLYGGADASELLDVLRAIEVPTIVVVHDVPLAPTSGERWVIEAVGELASRIVVTSIGAASRLTERFSVDPRKVSIVPHGAWPSAGDAAALGLDGSTRPQLLTWGLLGPDKGIEHVIKALTLLQDLRPRIRYTVAGATRPDVHAVEGDHYRQSLVREAFASDVAGAVRFDDTFRDGDELANLIAGSHVVVLPYDSTEHVVSGVLAEALGAGRPVIATAFPYAVEMLSDGAGIVVAPGDPAALAGAIRAAFTEPGRLAAMTSAARTQGAALAWSVVASSYRRLCDDLMAIRPAVAM